MFIEPDKSYAKNMKSPSDWNIVNPPVKWAYTNKTLMAVEFACGCYANMHFENQKKGPYEAMACFFQVPGYFIR